MTDAVKKEREPNFYLWTVCLSKWRSNGKDGVKLLDITAKSGVQSFAPHWEDLMLYKKGLMDEQEYTDRYLMKMDDSRRNNRDDWNLLSVFPYVAYACYCAEGVFCHRHLFKGLAQEHLESMGWTPKQMGEWTGVPGVEIPERFVKAYPANIRVIGGKKVKDAA